jgi:hypothetical protein
MPSQADDVVMPDLPTREDYIGYLESESEGAEPTGARLRRNLVKSYVIETVRGGARAPHAASVFAQAAGLRLTELDGGSLFALRDSDGVVALMEAAETRFPVIHSTRKAKVIDPIVHNAVMSSPWLDHVWLPGRFFDALWGWTRETVDPGRLAKLKFSYQASFERLDDRPGDYADETDEFDGDDLPADDEDGTIREVRHSQFEVADRVEVLDQRLERMRALYDPLQSTIQIRIPSTVRGGHEVYNFGKITNRSISFAEQQKIVRLVTDLYRRVTEGAEERLWYAADEDASGGGAVLRGRPVFLAFPEPLELSTLHWWAERTFTNRRNKFRLGGEPMWSGPDRTRLHVYGIDRHLWQPVSLEVTRNHLLAVLPAGTCGNTINRLVTNVQQYLSPSVRAWIGDVPYERLLDSGEPHG